VFEDMDWGGRFTFIDVIGVVPAIQHGDYSAGTATPGQVDTADRQPDGVVNFVDVIDLVFEL
jgi:hypothetical protein